MKVKTKATTATQATAIPIIEPTDNLCSPMSGLKSTRKNNESQNMDNDLPEKRPHKQGILGVTEIADTRGPYTPTSGIIFVPFPVQWKCISNVLLPTIVVNVLIISLPVPFASLAILKSCKTF